MTAVGECAAGVSGKCTHGVGSGRLLVGDATRTGLPHAAYADAVYAVLGEFGLLPDVMESGERREAPAGPLELFLRLEWLPGHEQLERPAMRADGLTVQWSHLADWSARTGADLVAVDIDGLADPAVVAEAVMHAALCGLRCACVRSPGSATARWDHAAALLASLAAYDQHTNGVAR